MTTTTSERRTFADKLRTEIGRRNQPGKPFGARTVARLIVARNPGRDLEQTRRSVIRWLNGMTPTQANRDEVTDALSMERGSLDPDAEEEDPAMAEQEKARRRADRALRSLALDEALQLLAAISAEERT